MRRGRRRVARAFGAIVRAILILLLLLTTLLGYGITDGDALKLRRFTLAVERWQVDPDFRQVAMEYSILSNEAMQARLAGISATQFMMALRSIPGLPDTLAVNPTSQLHYDNFTLGSLSAYLHLSGEQGTANLLGPFQTLGQRGQLTDEQVARFVESSICLVPPVRMDRGAVRGTRRLLNDIQPQRTFAPFVEPEPLCRPAIASLAGRLGFPADERRMTPAQQLRALHELDAEVCRLDPEKWRIKQVNDFSAGIWAQCFGRVYNELIVPLLVTRDVCRIAAPALLIGLLARRRRR